MTKYLKLLKKAEYFYKLAKEEPVMIVNKDDGTKSWILPSTWKMHREDGPAVERINGDKEWWLNGKRHREDGPAVELANGSKTWWLNGQLHREDGPAVEDANGTVKYWYHGVEKPQFRTEIVPLIKAYDPKTKQKTYQNEEVTVDWTDEIQNAWIFDLESLELDRLAKLEEAINKTYPVAKVEDIESGNI